MSGAYASALADDGKPKSQFAVKLHNMLEKECSEDLRWLDDDTFEITGDEALARIVLQQSFNMKSTASFIRQASYYGFARLSDRRKKGLSQSLHGRPPPIVFRHPSGLFVRGEPDLARTIPRVGKPPTSTIIRSKKAPRAFATPADPAPHMERSDSDSSSMPMTTAESSVLERPRPNRTVSCPAGLPTSQNFLFQQSQLSSDPDSRYVDWPTVLARPAYHAAHYAHPSNVNVMPNTAASSESSYYSPVEAEPREWGWPAPGMPYSGDHYAPPPPPPLHTDPGYFMRNSSDYFDQQAMAERARDDAYLQLPPVRLPSISAISGRTFANWMEGSPYADDFRSA